MAFSAIARSSRQKGRGQHEAIQEEGVRTPTNLTCDWSMRFMKVILLGLSLVRISSTETGLQYKCTAGSEDPISMSENFKIRLDMCCHFLLGYEV